jgi:predicted dehydrogenase
MPEAIRDILVVGTGSIGERHVRCFQRSRRAKISICEPNAELRNTVAKRYNVEQAFSELDRALEERAFDAAVICTPAHVHVPIAQNLAEHGINLLLEKPLSTTLVGLEQLSSTIKQRNLSCVVGYTWRSHPAALTMKQLIDSREYGNPVQIVATSGQNFPLYRPSYLSSYYPSHQTGGGCIQDSLTHILNLSEWLAGPVTSISADAANKKLESVDVEDMAHCMTRHETIYGSFAQNQFQAPNETTITVVCEEATLQMRTHECDLRVMCQPDSPWVVKKFRPLERDDAYVSQAMAFLNVLDGKGEPRCTLAEAWQTLKVNLAALKSVRSRQWEPID